MNEYQYLTGSTTGRLLIRQAPRVGICELADVALSSVNACTERVQGTEICKPTGTASFLIWFRMERVLRRHILP